jgi:hypothetical protein
MTAKNYTSEEMLAMESVSIAYVEFASDPKKLFEFWFANVLKPENLRTMNQETKDLLFIAFKGAIHGIGAYAQADMAMAMIAGMIQPLKSNLTPTPSKEPTETMQDLMRKMVSGNFVPGNETEN